MKNILFILLLFSFPSCKNNDDEFDASGSFEAEETIISSEASGTILEFKLEEGQVLREGQVLGFIDSTQLHLKKKQLKEQIKAVLSRKPEIHTQLAALNEQIKTAENEQKRISNLVKAGAAPQKQLDDINAQLGLLQKQIEAQKSTLGITSESISSETAPLEIQIEQLEDMISKCRIVNPVKGTVLTHYAKEKEIAVTGKPLYKIADLATLTLRAYISGTQLSRIRLSQKVNVSVDNGADSYKKYEGTVFWISEKAEFTPKTIQTKEERANLVYAIKVKVENDGLLKIGMFGGVDF